MQIDSRELSEFVKAVLAGINGGMSDDNMVAGTVKFQIGLKSVTDKKGDITLKEVGIGGGLGGNRSNEEIARIEFEVDDMLTVGSRKFDEWGKTALGKAFFEYIAKQQKESSGQA